MTINRRSFIQTAAAVTASLSAPMVMASGKPRVVVVGGGAGGATVARYIAKDSKGSIDVTLVEPSRTYYTCFSLTSILGALETLEVSHIVTENLHLNMVLMLFMIGPLISTEEQRQFL